MGKRALGSCWAKGPAVVGIRGTLGRGALWASGVLGGWANGAFGGCPAAIPNGKPFRVDVISIETRFGPSRSLPDVSKQYLLGSLGSDMIQNCIQPELFLASGQPCPKIIQNDVETSHSEHLGGISARISWAAVGPGCQIGNKTDHLAFQSQYGIASKIIRFEYVLVIQRLGPHLRPYSNALHVF